MLISGSQTQCITEAINSEYPFDALQLPGFDKLPIAKFRSKNTVFLK